MSSSEVYTIKVNKVVKLKRQYSAHTADQAQNSSATRPSVPSVKVQNYQTLQQSISPTRMSTTPSAFRNSSKTSQQSRNATKTHAVMKEQQESRNEYFTKTMTNVESLKKIILAN
jgi:hypothetical protein